MRRENPLFASTVFHGHNYSEPGYYGITLCTHHWRWFFGRVRNGEMQLNEIGRIAEKAWTDLANRWPNVTFQEHIFMPNHMHAIIQLTDFPGPDGRSVLGVMDYYKRRASYLVNHAQMQPDKRKLWLGWERGGWKVILMSEKRLTLARQYILTNPARWQKDEFYQATYEERYKS